MGQSGIPEEVEAFIRAHVDSVDELETLLFLRQAAARGASPADVAQELRVGEALAADRLASLVAEGLAEETQERSGMRYRYAPRTSLLERAVARLADVYPDRRVSIITLIFSKPSDKIRSFADAFKFRKDK